MARYLTFNNKGQLVIQYEGDPAGTGTGADALITLYEYDDRGRLEYTATDVNQNGLIDLAGPDRIRRRTHDVLVHNGVTAQRTMEWDWPFTYATPQFVGSQITAVNGRDYWSEVAKTFPNSSYMDQITHREQVHEVVNGARTGNWTVTTTRPDGTEKIETYCGGRLDEVKERSANGIQMSKVTYGYDPHGRVASETDGRNRTTSYAYDNADRRTSVTQPAPGWGQATPVTVIDYDERGRRRTITHPDNELEHFRYHPTGELKKTWGVRTYPVEYTYDAQGRMQTMTTWKDYDSASGGAVTTWTYDTDRGNMVSKSAPGAGGTVSYTYDRFGRLKTRTWARGIITTYSYNSAGDLVLVDYSDTTPSVSYQYNRRGQPLFVVDGEGFREFFYTTNGQFQAELRDGDGLHPEIVYDALGRIQNVLLWSEDGSWTTLLDQEYSYDSYSSRLKTVEEGNYTATYSYWQNTDFVNGIADGIVDTAITYDGLNRVTAVKHLDVVPSYAVGLEFYTYASLYEYNIAGLRTRESVHHWRDTLNPGIDPPFVSYWQYDYDFLGQVTSVQRYQSGTNTPVPGQQYSYGYDDIGNRTGTLINGQLAGYTTNVNNQYTKRDIPGTVDVFGLSYAGTTVTVNGLPTQRVDEYFHRELQFANDTDDRYEQITISDMGITTTGYAFLAKDQEMFSYDDDGNLLSDGRFTYTWDGENRLVKVETRNDLSSSVPMIKVEFGYDYMGRRVSKTVSEWQNSAWSVSAEQQFHWLEWNLLAEGDQNQVITRSYLWGLDLAEQRKPQNVTPHRNVFSSSAGGVGGLLALTVHGPTSSVTRSVSTDAEGNVVAVGTDTIFEYDAFGQTVRATGSLVEDMPFRFSTKYQDIETNLYYYGYRYYSARMGRWLNGDPIEERGGLNLYAFVRNDPVNQWDLLGLNGSWGLRRISPWPDEPLYFEERADRYDERGPYAFDVYANLWATHSGVVVDAALKFSLRGVGPSEADETIFRMESLGLECNQETGNVEQSMASSMTIPEGGDTSGTYLNLSWSVSASLDFVPSGRTAVVYAEAEARVEWGIELPGRIPGLNLPLRGTGAKVGRTAITYRCVCR